MKTVLTLHQLKLNVHLGWPDEERALPQSVVLDITIQPPSPPRACLTDQLDDTVCYDALTTKIRQVEARPFRLIEHLTQEIFKLLKNELGPDAKISVRLTKVPSIEGLEGGVSFVYGDA